MRVVSFVLETQLESWPEWPKYAWNRNWLFRSNWRRWMAKVSSPAELRDRQYDFTFRCRYCDWIVPRPMGLTWYQAEYVSRKHVWKEHRSFAGKNIIRSFSDVNRQDFAEARRVRICLAHSTCECCGRRKNDYVGKRRYCFESACDRCGGVASSNWDLGKAQWWQVHHVDGDPLNNQIRNLMFLCKPCHVAQGSWYKRTVKAARVRSHYASGRSSWLELEAGYRMKTGPLQTRLESFAVSA